MVCACGCGSVTPIAAVTRRGYRKGEYMRFAHGHNRRRYRGEVAEARCSGCAELLPAADFYPDRSRSTGLSSRCRACMKIANRTAYAADRERWLNAMAVYRGRPGGRERQRELNRQWEQADPARTRQLKRDRQETRRARKAQAFDEHVDGMVVYGRDKGLCGICGNPVSSDAFHVDHIIPLALGGRHSYVNVQAAHPFCNLAKGGRLQEG